MGGSTSTAASTVISGIPGGTSIPGLPTGSSTSPFPGSSGGITTTTGSGLSLASLAGSLLDVLVVLLLLSFVAVFVIIVVSNRVDPDPTGRRPQSVYFFAVSFVALGATIIGSTVVVIALVQFVGHHSGSITDTVARATLAGGLITLISAFLLSTHLRRGLEVARSHQTGTNPSRRVGQSYVAAVAFVAVATLLVALIVSFYLLVALAGPGVFGSFGGSTSTFRLLIVFLYLGGVSLLVLWAHRDLVPPGLGFLGRPADRTPAMTYGTAPGPGPTLP